METQPGTVQTGGVSASDTTISVGEWLLTLIIASIPIVNIVMWFVWGFGSNTKLCKANWAKASLLWMLIVCAFYFFVVVLIIGGIGVLGRRFY
jgi:hypothetical protein